MDASKTRTSTANTYIDLSLPIAKTFVLDVTCFVLQEGIVRSGFEPKSYQTEIDHAYDYLQTGEYSVINTGQLKIQIDLSKPMRYSPTVTAKVTYQDGAVDYSPTVQIADQKRVVLQLNSSANDVVMNWTADADI